MTVKPLLLQTEHLDTFRLDSVGVQEGDWGRGGLERALGALWG